MLTRQTLPAALACAVAVTATAAAPIWAGSGMPETVVKGEILEGWVTPSGTRMAALRLELAPGWKTYWRAPGDAGIPPTFAWEGSENLRGISYHWPSPDVFESYGLRSIGYAQELILPIELHPERPDAPIRLQGDMELGVCETVCVPASLTFEARLDGKGTSDPAIHSALANRPTPGHRAGVEQVTCDLDPISDGVSLRAEIRMPQMGGTEIALVETGDPRIWVSEPQTQRTGGTLEVRADLVPPTGKPMALDRSALRFTVIGAHNAVDIRGCSAP